MNACKMSTYWTESSEGYSEVILDEMEHEQKEVWQNLIDTYRPPGEHLNVLDAGCGPGFFSILMAQQGHKVTAIDFSEGMLEQAKRNAGNYGVGDDIDFFQMDAQEPVFEDNTFDLILSRNITWIFREPIKAYKEWLRILKPKGRFLAFDGNWYLHLYDEEVYRQYLKNMECAKALGYQCKKVHGISAEEEEQMMKDLPLSGVKRPEWDQAALAEIGCDKVTILHELPRNAMREIYAVKNEHTPMFMVCAEKA